MNRSEQETTITYSAADEIVRIWTCVPKDLRAMTKDSRFQSLQGGTYRDGSVWGEFTIPANQWNPIRGAKRRLNLTDEQRQQLADRLAGRVGEGTLS